jgi:3-hydroxy-9,10-secoandrosta-1,3,5(10)-triene-9,17-dione monooxygenase reductase component
MVARDRIAPALGKIPSGIFVATAIVESSPIGMLCSFVEQAGFEPPMISIALGLSRPLRAVLERGDLFGVNILGKQNGALIKPFSRSDVKTPFDGLELVENEFGIPQLAAALAFLICKPEGSMPAGDHVLFLARVLDGALQQEKQEAMVRVRQNGFGY